MPESEMFKMILQGGMLGLWIVVVWWGLAKGIPMLKEQVDRLIASHQATVLQISAENRSNITDLNNAHKDAVKVLSDTHREAVNVLDKTHREVVNNLAKECREERKEIMNVLYLKLGMEEFKDKAIVKA